MNKTGLNIPMNFLFPDSTISLRMSSHKTQELIEETNIDHEHIEYINITNEVHVNLDIHFQELRNEIGKKKRKANYEFGNILGTYINKKIVLKLN